MQGVGQRPHSALVSESRSSRDSDSGEEYWLNHGFEPFESDCVIVNVNHDLIIIIFTILSVRFQG